MAGESQARAKRKPAAKNGGESERKQVREMELLLRISQQISAIDDLDELLYAIVEMCTQETDAERGTLFLADQETGELYSRVAQGLAVREIRIMNNQGIAGAVFTSGTGIIVHDAYTDERFDSSIDEETNYQTRNLVCAPIRFRNEVIGVLQMLNKRKRRFTHDDLHLLEAMAEQTAIALRSVLFMEKMKTTREQEMRFLEFVAEVTGHLDLGTMLNKIVNEAARMLKADRATLFLNDEKKNQLFSRIALGEKMGEIRIPNHLGIAGSVFT
jgi:adenylate cyclase